MNLGIDCDGVLRDQVKAFTEKYLKEYPEHRNLVKPVTAWDMAQFYPLGKEIYKLWFGPWVKECMEDAPMFDGAKEFVAELRRRGHKVFVCTSQPMGTERHTIAWLDKHQIERDGIIFANQKGITHFDVLLDDGEHNLEAVSMNKTLPVCFDQPWNQNWRDARVCGKTEREKYESFLRFFV